MSQFIESFLCDLKKYLSKEGEKLFKDKNGNTVKIAVFNGKKWIKQ